jgi:hypothetical protein
VSGGVGRDCDDEVGVEGCADALQQWDRGDDPAGFQAREGRLGYVSAGCEFDLGQSQSHAAFADYPADQERPAGFACPSRYSSLSRRPAASSS